MWGLTKESQLDTFAGVRSHNSGCETGNGIEVECTMLHVQKAIFFTWQNLWPKYWNFWNDKKMKDLAVVLLPESMKD